MAQRRIVDDVDPLQVQVGRAAGQADIEQALAEVIEIAFDELDRLAPRLGLLLGLGACLVVGALLVGLGLLLLGDLGLDLPPGLLLELLLALRDRKSVV